MPALGDAGEGVLRARTSVALRRPGRGRALGETVLHREPCVIVDDPPLWQVDHQHLRRLRPDASHDAASSRLLDLPVRVDPAIARVPEHRADAARRPRAGAASPAPGRRHAFAVEGAGERLETEPPRSRPRSTPCSRRRSSTASTLPPTWRLPSSLPVAAKCCCPGTSRPPLAGGAGEEGERGEAMHSPGHARPPTTSGSLHVPRAAHASIQLAWPLN